MRQIVAWFENHKVLGNLIGGVALIGGIWLLVGYFVSQAKPDTSTAHIYCAMLVSNPDGSFNQEGTRAEFELSRKLAYEQGSEAGVEQAKIEGEKIMREYMEHAQKGDLADLRHHYQEKCLGY